MKINNKLKIAAFAKPVERLFALAAEKTLALDARWKPGDGAPVFTIAGKYTARAWTAWTQGFQFGNALLAFEVTGDHKLLEAGRKATVNEMAEHLTHIGVHDHGFNNLSTYGQLRRLMLEGAIEQNDWELAFYELALKVSGAVQAARWTNLGNGEGYVYSFNGAHSLFIDTIRTVRISGVSHLLGHTLMGEQDAKINLLGRLLTHGKTTAKYNLFYGEGRDIYDRPELRGRTSHEAIFNVASGAFRCPSTQQGYSAFSTWTRGLAWAMLGFAEELEFLSTLPESEFTAAGAGSKAEILAIFERAAKAACDFYIEQGTAQDGICYWDTGAPDLHKLGDWKGRAAEPYNDFEPVDASASAIAAQGLLRLGHYLEGKSGIQAGERYWLAGLTVSERLLHEDYLATNPSHEGILLHSVYHRPNGWDSIPAGAKVPVGESSMWGDYHLLELGTLLWKLTKGRYYTFYGVEGAAK